MLGHGQGEVRVDLAAEGLKERKRLVDAGADAGLHALDEVLAGDADLLPGDVAAEVVAHVGPGGGIAGRVAGVVAANAVEDGGDVLNVAADGTDLVEGAAEGDDAEAANPPVGGVEADDAAEGGGLADAAARVAAEGGEALAGGDGSGGAAGAAAGDAVGVPGIAGGAVGGVFGAGAHGKLVHVGLADHDGARALELFVDMAVVGRDEVAEHA